MIRQFLTKSNNRIKDNTLLAKTQRRKEKKHPMLYIIVKIA